MSIVIRDEKTGIELWTVQHVIDNLGIPRGTISSYASRGLAPAPFCFHSGIALWDARELQEWDRARRLAKLEKKGKS